MVEVTAFQMLCITYGELIAHAGLIRATLRSVDELEDVADRFDEKLSTLVEHLQQEIAEIQEFGSAFDDPDEV